MHLLCISLRIFDIVSDILYILKVPFVNTGLLVACVIFIILPFSVNLFIAISKKDGFCNIMMFWLLLNLNLLNITEKRGTDAQALYSLNRFTFMILEDLPQLGLQTWNTLHIGKTSTWWAICSPVTSFLGCIWAANLVIYSQFIDSQNKGFQSDSWNTWSICRVIGCYMVPLLTPLAIFLYVIFMIYSLKVSKEDFPAWAEENFDYTRF